MRSSLYTNTTTRTSSYCKWGVHFLSCRVGGCGQVKKVRVMGKVPDNIVLHGAVTVSL